MQTHEVLAVEREDHAVFLDGECENFIVRHRLSASAGLLDSQYVVPESAEGVDRGKWEVFIGIEPHQSGRLVFGDLAFDLLTMSQSIGPCIGEIDRSKSWVGFQKGGFGQP